MVEMNPGYQSAVPLGKTTGPHRFSNAVAIMQGEGSAQLQGLST